MRQIVHRNRISARLAERFDCLGQLAEIKHGHCGGVESFCGTGRAGVVNVHDAQRFLGAAALDERYGKIDQNIAAFATDCSSKRMTHTLLAGFRSAITPGSIYKACRCDDRAEKHAQGPHAGV